MLDQMDMYKARLGDYVEEVKSEYGYIETDPSDRYGRFKEVLGKGAMKTVYKAFDQVLGMEVAWNQVKLNDVFRSPDELQRLYSEVHLLSTLNHDSIIQFYTSWIDVERRTFNFITEMLTSGTLRQYRQRYRQVDIRAVKNWARQILHGLVYLHGHDPPVIHRDLKCDNIFVNGHLGQVKIGDLGFAAILRDSCQAHSVIGTPEFMAPELYEEEYDELVDIYSFGMCVLEMLTSEYPYSECSNPAQIYKKVTSGKLPDAFYRIHDEEARRFVGKCLETASKRLPAKELLLDPFLASDEAELFPIPKPKIRTQKPIANDIGLDKSGYVPPVDPTWSTDIKITGKMNQEDDTIYLKVQIADKYGSTRNIYFPFDIVNDTPIDVATEMVKELEINDREPFEIAEVIDKEISALVPEWKDRDPQQNQTDHQSFNYLEVDDDDDDENGGHHHPFYSFSSCSSSQASLSGLLPPSGTHFTHGGYNHDMSDGCDWLQDDDDASSQSSLHSGKYSNMNYQSVGSEHDCDLMRPREHHTPQILKTPKCTTRFCPETTGTHHKQQLAGNFDHHHETAAAASTSKDVRRTVRQNSNRTLTRNQSLVDVRSQLLHRSLVEEVNKRRLFKTVGAVENIGYQTPFDQSAGKAPSPSPPPTGVGWSVKGITGPRWGKTKQGFKW